MIIVRVELHSAITRQVTELARMKICNTGELSAENPNRGDYRAEVFRGRSRGELDKGTIQKWVDVLNYPRLQLHVWNLVARALSQMNYK